MNARHLYLGVDLTAVIARARGVGVGLPKPRQYNSRFSTIF